MIADKSSDSEGSQTASTATRTQRMLFVAHRFQKNDGQGRVNYEVVRSLLDQGWPLTLLTAHCDQRLAEHPLATVVQLGNEKRPTQFLRNLAFASESARWIRAHRSEFDLVQLNGFTSWEPGDIVTAHFVHSAWARNPHYPFGKSLKPYHLYQRAFTYLNARFERKVFAQARHIIAVSPQVGRDIQDLGVEPGKIEVIANGVDIEEFHPGQSVRASFHLPETVPMALFVGDIKSPRKNLGTLLRAAAELKTLHVAVAGGTEGSSAPAEANALGLSDRVHFLGKTPRVADLMRSVDLFVFPSRYEAHPLVVLEAMASQLPIVLSNGIEIAREYPACFEVLTETENARMLAKLIQHLLDDGAYRSARAETARRQAVDLQWAHTTRAYQAAYERLAAEKKKAG